MTEMIEGAAERFSNEINKSDIEKEAHPDLAKIAAGDLNTAVRISRDKLGASEADIQDAILRGMSQANRR